MGGGGWFRGLEERNGEWWACPPKQVWRLYRHINPKVSPIHHLHHTCLLPSPQLTFTWTCFPIHLNWYCTHVQKTLQQLPNYTNVMKEDFDTHPFRGPVKEILLWNAKLFPHKTTNKNSFQCIPYKEKKMCVCHFPLAIHTCPCPLPWPPRLQWMDCTDPSLLQLYLLTLVTFIWSPSLVSPRLYWSDSEWVLSFTFSFSSPYLKMLQHFFYL